MTASYLVSSQTFTGKYQMEGDKIHFLDPADEHNFIPQTVTIWQDKIILQFDKEGQPDLRFAQYFDIIDNLINKAP
jgi:hypothetical protein